MTTKPPASVQDFPAESTEKIAYAAVESIQTQEPNDRNRLGYHVWRWMTSRQGTLEEAVNESGARILTDTKQAVAAIRGNLEKAGVMV